MSMEKRRTLCEMKCERKKSQMTTQRTKERKGNGDHMVSKIEHTHAVRFSFSGPEVELQHAYI